LEELRDIPGIEFKLGRHDEADFRNADLVVVNPAVHPGNPYLQIAMDAGIPRTSEMNLFWQWNPATVVAVTGSNGKSTTTALIHSIVRSTGRRAWLGGNIGVSLLPRVDQIQKDDVVVLELSSFQLTDLDRLQVSPAVSVITNFAPNHLDWHPSLEHYRWAKQTMLRWQTPSDSAILNADDVEVSAWPTVGRKVRFGLKDTGGDGVFMNEHGVVMEEHRQAVVRLAGREQSYPISEWLKLPGRHNLSNALAAIGAATQFDVDRQALQTGIEQYEPLPHRLQWIADIAGRSYYNDSLATTPESAIAAVEAFDAPCILLAGGYDKHVDLSQLAGVIARNAKAVALMGQTSGTLRDLIGRCTDSTCVLSPELPSFRQAFDWAVSQSSPGDVILLSPGCASYDWFRNFADRGRQFVELVQGEGGRNGIKS
jgi:UDP-N-acetylmuramoylalanine--D-glutamate ligase